MICGNTSIQLGARNIPVTVEETHAVAEKNNYSNSCNHMQLLLIDRLLHLYKDDHTQV